MSPGPHRPFVSVKLSPVGRTYSFLIPELAFDGVGSAGADSAHQPANASPPAVRLKPGDAVVVNTAEGRALGTVTRSVHELGVRKSPPEGSDLQVVRRATREDVVT